MKAGALGAWIRSPTKRGIDHYLSSDPSGAFIVGGSHDFAGRIRTKDCGQTDAGILSATYPDITMVDRGGSHTDEDLARPGRRRRPLLDPEVFRIAHCSKNDCAHVAILIDDFRLLIVD